MFQWSFIAFSRADKILDTTEDRRKQFKEESKKTSEMGANVDDSIGEDFITN